MTFGSYTLPSLTCIVSCNLTVTGRSRSPDELHGTIGLFVMLLSTSISQMASKKVVVQLCKAREVCSLHTHTHTHTDTHFCRIMSRSNIKANTIAKRFIRQVVIPFSSYLPQFDRMDWPSRSPFVMVVAMFVVRAHCHRTHNTARLMLGSVNVLLLCWLPLWAFFNHFCSQTLLSMPSFDRSSSLVLLSVWNL
jgi:hypothetical protein